MQNNVNNATNNGGEAIKLLELSSSDSLESPNFSHFPAPKPKRKVRFKKAFRPSSKQKTTTVHSSKVCNCRFGDAAKLLASFLLLALVVALVWYVINLSTRIQELQKQFNDIEARNRNTPEELHFFHSSLRELDFNVTRMFTVIKNNIESIENVTAEIKQLKEATSNLEASIAAAPTIKQLPKDVSSLSERVVTFGSKITALESATKELKESQTSIQSTTQNLYDELDSVKNALHELSNSSKANTSEMQLKQQQPSPLVRDLTFQSAIEGTKQLVLSLQKELIDLTRVVDKMNSTFSKEIALFSGLPNKIEAMNEAIVYIVNDTHAQNARMFSIENYAYSNLTLQLEHIENECCKNSDKSHQYLNMSEVLDLVNKTITKSIVNIVSSDFYKQKKMGNSSKGLVVNTYNSLVLLAELLKQFSDIPEEELLSEKNASELVRHLLNNSFQGSVKDLETKVKVLQVELSKLSTIVQQSQIDKSSNQTVTSANSVMLPDDIAATSSVVPLP